MLSDRVCVWLELCGDGGIKYRGQGRASERRGKVDSEYAGAGGVLVDSAGHECRLNI